MTLRIIAGTAHADDDYPLGGEALRALWRMEERHFWHRARNRWILRAVDRAGLSAGASFLEVGCGSGTVTGALHQAGFRVTGVDTSRVQLDRANARFPDALFLQADVGALDPDEHGPFDGVGFFDVLEHLSEPEALLESSLKLAAPGALVIATVPAQQRLFTALDTLSGHKKRYEAGELERLLTTAGLEQVTEAGLFRTTTALRSLFLRKLVDLEVEALTPEEIQQVFVDSFRVPSFPLNLGLGLLCRLERGDGRSAAGATLIATGRVPS